jgi:transcriptional regulator with XRE-family HTH domain
MGQIEFASLMGISQSVVSRWESGAQEPTAGELVRMAKVIGCSVDALLGMDDVSDERERALKRFYEIIRAAKEELGETLTFINVMAVLKNVWDESSTEV